MVSSEPADAAKRRRRRNWIVACSLPGYVAFFAFALVAWMQTLHLEPPDSLILVTVAFGTITMLSWALAPFFVVIALVMLLRDRWRRERPRRQRMYLTLLVMGSPVAWILSNAIVDRYHLLR